MKEAELAVRVAETPQLDPALGQYNVYIADRKVDIAMARAETSLAEDQRAALSQQRDKARLDEMHAKATDRGMVVAVGDLQFTSGRADLKPGATDNPVADNESASGRQQNRRVDVIIANPSLAQQR